MVKTGQMPRLILVFPGLTNHIRFCHSATLLFIHLAGSILLVAILLLLCHKYL